jgi:diguanylate cyclase (GGDEF)-like protein
MSDASPGPGLNAGAASADNYRMRLRFWIGLSAVLLLAAGSVVAALAVYANAHADIDKMQREEAARAAHQTEAVAALSVGQLSSAAAFFRAEGQFSSHEFDVIARSLLQQEVLLGTAFIRRLPSSGRARFERVHGVQIFERGPGGLLRRAQARRAYFPLTYAQAKVDTGRAIGYDLASDPERGPFLRRARDSGGPVASSVVRLVLGGDGVVVYKAVYRDGAPIRTVAQRRAALIGFASGSFRVPDLVGTAVATLPDNAEVQLRIGDKVVIGPEGELEGASVAPIQIADRTWLLVVRDPASPSISLPLLLAVVGIALAILLGALILVWSRDERMQELQREAGEDSLTGLKNRRRFEEDLRAVMARGRRERTFGALLMIDLDHFKYVNDTHGHPAGDRLIEEIAAVLRRRTRESDVLARLGGDEFAVVLPRSSLAEARVVAEAIAAAIREHEPEHDPVDPVTASIGVAMFGHDPRIGSATIVAEADTAMYAAKDSGRDCVRVFDPRALSEDARETI